MTTGCGTFRSLVASGAAAAAAGPGPPPGAGAGEAVICFFSSLFLSLSLYICVYIYIYIYVYMGAGAGEAVGLREAGEDGVARAIQDVASAIGPALIGEDPADQAAVDKARNRSRCTCT